MNKSERRIERNRIRRKRELRKNIQRVFVTLVMVPVLSFTAGSFLTDAKADTAGVKYKYYKSTMVKAGDSLWSIAAKNMGAEYKDREAYIKEVKSMNHLEEDEITAGNYLVLPYYSDRFVGEELTARLELE